jgi:hypothetical protein
MHLARYAWRVGNECEVVLRRAGPRAYYHAFAGASAVTRSRSFDPDDPAGVARARQQVDAVLRALGWLPIGPEWGRYRQSGDEGGGEPG